MKLIFVLLTVYLNLFHLSEPKKCRVVVDDQVLSYEIDKRVKPATWQFSFDEFILEQIDDDNITVGGQVKSLRTMDPKLPLQMSISTKFYATSTWNEGPIRLFVPDICKEMTNPTRFWYNITKLWTLCPAKEGDLWPIERQSVDVLIDLPPSLPIGMWKIFFLLSQGIPGMEKFKYGYGLKLELVIV